MGLEPPAAIDDLKPWIARQLEADAAKTTLRECGLDGAPKGEPGAAITEKAACGDRAKDETAASEQ